MHPLRPLLLERQTLSFTPSFLIYSPIHTLNHRVALSFFHQIEEIVLLFFLQYRQPKPHDRHAKAFKHTFGKKHVCFGQTSFFRYMGMDKATKTNPFFRPLPNHTVRLRHIGSIKKLTRFCRSNRHNAVDPVQSFGTPKNTALLSIHPRQGCIQNVHRSFADR